MKRKVPGTVTLKERGYIGLAGEFRVMSELLLRGYNPAKSYLQDGYDLILDNGLRIEVKSAHYFDYGQKHYCKQVKKGKKYDSNTSIRGYFFNFRSFTNPSNIRKKFDYAICWCIDDNVFYIIPVELITGGGITIRDFSENSKHKYTECRNNWNQLNKGG